MKKDDQGNRKPRPLVVCFKKEAIAETWHNGGRGLKMDVGEEENKRTHWINPDLCRADREARFFARLERRKRKEEREAQRVEGLRRRPTNVKSFVY